MSVLRVVNRPGYIRQSKRDKAVKPDISPDSFLMAKRYTAKDGKEWVDMMVPIEKLLDVVEGKYSVSLNAQRIKGKSSRLIRERFPEMKRWCEGSLWSPGYFHGSVGHGAEVVERYIRSQEGLSLEVRLENLRRTQRPRSSVRGLKLGKLVTS